MINEKKKKSITAILQNIKPKGVRKRREKQRLLLIVRLWNVKCNSQRDSCNLWYMPAWANTFFFFPFANSWMNKLEFVLDSSFSSCCICSSSKNLVCSICRIYSGSITFYHLSLHPTICHTGLCYGLFNRSTCSPSNLHDLSSTQPLKQFCWKRS